MTKEHTRKVSPRTYNKTVYYQVNIPKAWAEKHIGTDRKIKIIETDGRLEIRPIKPLDPGQKTIADTVK